MKVREILPSVQSSYMGTTGWPSQNAVRLDFEKLSRLMEGVEQDPDNIDPPVGWAAWDVHASQDTIVFLKSKETAMRLYKKRGVGRVAVQADQVLGEFGVDNRTTRKFRYSTSKIDKLLHLASLKKVGLLFGGRSHTGTFFQSFSDLKMDAEDWISLGFVPPISGRPALDTRGDAKGLTQEYICVSYDQLELLEGNCKRIWDSYIDSSYEGVFFSKLEVSRTVWSGVTAGMAEGSQIFMDSDFQAGLPYRPAWNKFEALPSEVSGARTYSIVCYRNGQYVGFDPLCKPKPPELTIRWKSLTSSETGLFAAKGRYLPAKQIRSSYYVSPHTKARMVWEQGTHEPYGEKCLLSTEAGGAYTPRPCKNQYRELVRKYGSRAVPRNFNKYKESQISRKSVLVKNVDKGEWVFVTSNADFDCAVAEGYRKIGKAPLSWRILRQIHLPGETERDPFGNGLYARLVTREELLASTERIKKMARTLKVDGWEFLLEEIMSDEARLKRALFTLVAT